MTELPADEGSSSSQRRHTDTPHGGNPRHDFQQKISQTDQLEVPDSVKRLITRQTSISNYFNSFTHSYSAPLSVISPNLNQIARIRTAEDIQVHVKMYLTNLTAFAWETTSN